MGVSHSGAGFFHSYGSDKKDDTLSKTDRTPIAASFVPTREKNAVGTAAYLLH